jgi:hypothetical protein
MKAAEYPEHKCLMPAGTDTSPNHFCDLRQLHPGPCAALSYPPSVEARDKWEESNPGFEKLTVMDDPFRDIKP